MVIGWGWQKTWGFIAAILVLLFLFIFISDRSAANRQSKIEQRASYACKLLNKNYLAVGTYADVTKGTYLTLCGKEVRLEQDVDEINIVGRVEFVLK